MKWLMLCSVAAAVIASQAWTEPVKADDKMAAFAGSWQYAFRCRGNQAGPPEPLAWDVQPNGDVVEAASGERIGELKSGKWGQYSFLINIKRKDYPPLFGGRTFGVNSIKLNLDEATQRFTGEHSFAPSNSGFVFCKCEDVAMARDATGLGELPSEPTKATCRRIVPPATRAGS